MKDKIRIAIIGCGNIANGAHIPAYMSSEHCEIKYFCDIIPERADKAVETNGCGKAVYDYREILDDPELDAVSVCTHNDHHAGISIDFMRHGKDVLCEKPAARILSEALEMEKVSYETGRILSIGVCNRYSNSVNRIKDMIAEGKLGEVYHVYASFRAHRSIPGLGGDFTTKAVSGGGALIDWGVHYLDLIMYCLQDPKVLSCDGEAFSKLGVDGALYEVQPTFVMNDMHHDEVIDFVEAVREGRRTRNDIKYAVGTSKIMQAVYDSSEKHGEVKL